MQTLTPVLCNVNEYQILEYNNDQSLKDFCNSISSFVNKGLEGSLKGGNDIIRTTIPFFCLNAKIPYVRKGYIREL